MGAWSTSVTGNDTAQDLKSEYQAAFYYNDVETALKKIDKYVREEGFCESDESIWCDYYYSLADFMWRKGILTDAVKDEVVRLIDCGFGLDVWEESGKKTLESRKKALQTFRDKITSPQPPKKKITIGIHINPIFETGDVVTFQLQTVGKIYNTAYYNNVNENDFKEADGKYVAVRKIHDIVSYQSRVEPCVKNIWAAFQLYDKIFEKPPEFEEVVNLNSAHLPPYRDFGKPDNPNGIFIMESSMFYFKKRKYVVLGNHQDDIDSLVSKYFLDTRVGYFNLTFHIYFGINNDCNIADAGLINSIAGR